MSSKKPIIIIGESALGLKSGKYILEEIKNFLNDNNFIKKDWNALNFLPQNASTVGLIDLKILSEENEKQYSFFDKLNNNEFKLLYLLGSDNLEFKKGDFPLAENLANSLLSIPLYPGLKKSEQEFIVHTIRKFF